MEKKLTDEEWFDEYAKRCKDYEDGYYEQLACGGTSDAQAEKEIEFDRRLIAYVHRLQDENAGLKKLVGTLEEVKETLLAERKVQKAEIERLKNFIDFKTANVMCDKCKEQAVKDTAKDSLEQFVCAMVNMEYVGVNDDLYYQMLELKDTLLKEKYGVEVE